MKLKIPVDLVVKLDNGHFVTDNMYVYEGHDYSKEKPEADNDAFEKCLEGEPDLKTEYICIRKQISTQFYFCLDLRNLETSGRGSRGKGQVRVCLAR